MISKAQIKYIQSLKITKFRQKYNIFVAEGDKLVKEILSQKRFKYQYVIVSSSWESENHTFLEDYRDVLLVVTSKEMKKLSSLKTPPGIIVLLYKQDMLFKKELLMNEYSLYLDKIMDPGNMGTIIRIADWYGFKNIICAPGSVDYYNPKTIQSSMGSIARVNLFVVDYNQLKESSVGIPIYAAVLDGELARSYDFSEDQLILAIGNESHGISKELLVIATNTITISDKHNLGAESLNAAVATAVLCSKIRS